MIVEQHMPTAPAAGNHDVIHTTCCIVGGGPAGAVLALLLSRRGVPVVLLEAHADFDREFRGDTVHPSVMEVMDQLGLADQVLHLRHTKLERFSINVGGQPLQFAPFDRLPTRFPYVTMLPQKDFLEFLTAQTQHYRSFQLIMGARVEQLIEEGGAVRGVRFHDADGWHEVRALLTVGADGRFSKVRKLAGIEQITTAPPMDVLWFKLPRRSSDPTEIQGRISNGRMVVLINRFEYWQCAYLIPKGSYHTLQAAGLPALQTALAELVPLVADRVATLQAWKQFSLLFVEAGRCPRWHAPGLLLIGDAAHTMSPVGGVGINYAIMDAVATANILGDRLKAGQVDERDLARVQRRRELPTRLIQLLQGVIQRRIVASALDTSQPLTVPPIVRWLLRLPIVRNLPGRVIGYGFRPEHVRG